MIEAYRQNKEKIMGIYRPYCCGLQFKEGVTPWAPPHYHDYIELLYCTEGHGKYLAGDESGDFSVGDLVLIDSQKVHATYALDEKKTSYICIRLDPQLLYSPTQTIFELKYILPFTLNNCKHQSLFRKEELKDTPVHDIIMRMLKESQEESYGYELAIRASLCDLFLWILRYWQSQNVHLELGASIVPEDAQILTQAIEYIEANFASNLTLSDVAKHCNMSYSGFSRLFNKYMQKRFVEYLAELRISKARQRLATTADSITDIAMQTGYTTTSYFIQQFKEYNGITPKQFRENFNMK
ncbi:MAG: helix-turn-helix domain-containing protein [Clostridia bacterium]|nr:helix-turn-helix domain-containing protein [Clostridia bacterium]